MTTPAATSEAPPHVGRVALTRVALPPHHTHRSLDHPQQSFIPKPLAVPMSLYAENRQKLCARLQATATTNPGQTAVVLMQGGAEEYRHESDTEKLFRQESSFHYLFGVKEPGFYGTIDVATGQTTLFMPRLPAEYAVWMGAIRPPAFFQDHYEVDRVQYVDELPATLRAVGPGLVLYLNQGVNTDSGNAATPAEVAGVTDGTTGDVVVDVATLYPALVECRVHKTAAELKVLRYANDISSDAHLEVMRQVKPGMTEYQLESLFLHHGYFFGGCRHVAYTSICGCGPNAATLHYGHAGAPNDREIKDGDMLLLDMGAEYHCYASDITCSFPASGTFTTDQRMVFEAVQAMQFAVLDALRPGVAWTDMHALAYRVGCEHLIQGGLLLGSVETLMEKNVMSFFMPHGLGHFMGKDVHDCGGYPPALGLARDARAGYKSLRTVRVMEPGMVITVEPGIYFIDVLLDQLLADEDLRGLVDAEVLETRFRGFGGVRLEDDVVITEDGIVNMTHAPRTVADVEAVMAGKITSKSQLFKKY